MKNDLVIGGVVLVAIGIGLYFLLREPGIDSRPPEPAPAVSVPATETTPPERAMTPEDQSMPATATAPTPPPPPLPPLSESDGFFRQTLAQLSVPESWLAREDLVRRLAVVMDNARKGEYPRQQLGFMAPAGKFEVIQDGDRLRVDPISYERFDGYMDTLESMDPNFVAGWMTTFEPLIAEALGELGNPGKVNAQAIAAIDLLLAIPELGAEVELVQPKVFYEYADPALEGLKPLQKQALRMGPTNVRRMKAYLTRLRAELVN